MIVLGIDPGTRHLGWGILRREGTRALSPGARRHRHRHDPRPRRKASARSKPSSSQIIEQFHPTAAAVRALSFAKDATAAAKLDRRGGVALLVLARAGLPIAEYEPTRVKKPSSGMAARTSGQVA